MIYLASPYSHPDPGIREWRFLKVAQLTVRLLDQNKSVFSPIVYSHHMASLFGLKGTWDFWRRLDLDFIDRCDELWVYQLPGWELSVGVQAEIEHAKATGKPVSFIAEGAR